MEDNEDILLSVVVPIFNVENYLELCLQSLCEALLDVPTKQVICVNDGSTDNSLSIIKRFVDQYDFVECIDKENAGYGAAINSGMAQAKGEYFTIVESDDCIIPDVYNDLLLKMSQNPEADFIKTPYLVWVNGRVTNTIRLKDAPETPFSAEEYPEALLFPPSIWSAIYRKSYLDNNNIHVIETPGASYQDTFFSTLLFLEGGKMLYHDEAYYLYRNDRLDASRHSKTKTTEIIHIFDEIKRILDIKGAFKGKVEVLYYVVFFKRLIWFFSTVYENFQVDIFKLGHNRFIPVFDDPVLYARVEIMLNPTEKKQLFDLKNGAFECFHSVFNKPATLPQRRSDFMFYHELRKYLANKPLVLQYKKTIFHKVSKAIYLEGEKMVGLATTLLKSLKQQMKNL